MNKEPLLYLCHRIPFPPNKGDKIRSFNILKKLNETYDVHLACFIDDPFDWQYVDTLKQYCSSLLCLNQNKTVAKLKGMTSFLTGKPITLPYYYDAKMARWVKDTVAEHSIKKAFIYSSSMAQYCDGEQYNKLKKVIDFVDVDSDKWRQYAEKKTGIAKWVFNREFRLLAQYEDATCQKFDASLFVSPDEAALFAERQPKSEQSKVHGLLNGVDVDFFDPTASFKPEDIPEKPFISFTGAMDYWANVESVVWFVDNVWPTIVAKHPDCLFYIVGGNPSKEVQQLAQHQGVIVTGRVHDIRPYIAKAKYVVAPMRIARGIQNKVLEAMSLNKSIVCTTMAMEGINAQANEHVHVVDDPIDYAKSCLSLLENDSAGANRQWIIDNFTWQATLRPLQEYFN